MKKNFDEYNNMNNNQSSKDIEQQNNSDNKNNNKDTKITMDVETNHKRKMEDNVDGHDASVSKKSRTSHEFSVPRITAKETVETITASETSSKLLSSPSPMDIDQGDGSNSEIKQKDVSNNFNQSISINSSSSSSSNSSNINIHTRSNDDTQKNNDNKDVDFSTCHLLSNNKDKNDVKKIDQCSTSDDSIAVSKSNSHRTTKEADDGSTNESLKVKGANNKKNENDAVAGGNSNEDSKNAAIDLSTKSKVKQEEVALSKFYKWTAPDDLLLKNCMEKGMKPNEILEQMKLNAKYTENELTERWRALLYDKEIAEPAAKAMTVLIQGNNKRIPWTEEENKLILDELEAKKHINFAHFLDRNRENFHPCRTLKSLEAHFYRMKRNGEFDHIEHLHHAPSKLKNETLVDNLSSVEAEILNSSDNTKDSAIPPSIRLKDKKHSKQAVTLEKEHVNNTLKKGKKLSKKKKKSKSEKVTGIKAEETKAAAAADVLSNAGDISGVSGISTTGSSDALPDQEQEETFQFAQFCGMKCKLSISKEHSVIGRMCKNGGIDVDVSLEGNAGKVSRKQAELSILPVRTTKTLTTVTAGDESKPKSSNNLVSKRTGPIDVQFQLKNVGKRDILVNNEVVKSGTDAVLSHNALVQFPGELKFTFLVDDDEINRWLETKHSQVGASLASNKKKKGK